MSIDVTQVILAIIAVISAIITGFLIPLLKARLNVENGRLTENQAYLLNLAVTTAVTAAEQLYKSDEGQKKKAYVLSLLETQGYRCDSAALDAAIEAAVLELHNAMKE